MKTQLVSSSTRPALWIIAVASTGCLIIPGKEHEVPSGRKLEAMETAGWRIGETKRAEVLQQLGAPYAEFQDPNATDSVTLTATTNETSYVEAKVTSGTGQPTLRLTLVASGSGRKAIRRLRNNVGTLLPGHP